IAQLLMRDTLREAEAAGGLAQRQRDTRLLPVGGREKARLVGRSLIIVVIARQREVRTAAEAMVVGEIDAGRAAVRRGTRLLLAAELRGERAAGDHLRQREICAGPIGNAAIREAAIRRIHESGVGVVQIEAIGERLPAAADAESVGAAIAILRPVGSHLELSARRFCEDLEARRDLESREESE